MRRIVPVLRLPDACLMVDTAQFDLFPPGAVVAPVLLPAGVEHPSTATRRVLHVINGEHYSGAERVQDLLAQELPQFGFEVEFACLKPDRFPLVRQSRAAAIHNTPMSWRFDIRCVRQLSRLIQNEKFALVHAHTPRSVLVGGLAARHAGVPLIYHVHSPTKRDSTRRFQNLVNAMLESWSLRYAARLIAVSPSLKRLMQAQGFSADRVTYVPNGVPRQAVGQRQPPDKVWTLGIAALFRPRKGIEVLLESLAMLRSRDFDVRLRAVGPFETPAYGAEVRALVDRLGVGDIIT
ncbi:MAG: glycosyltransferase, partial [Planctomycetales bacterium]|nr:glycosyltransferase [Planctomycetales bacterium]